MELKKFSIDVEKLGNIEIFSYDGYILGYKRRFSYEISFFPIVINKDSLNEDFLHFYLNFNEILNSYNGEEYDPEYNVYFKNYDKLYENCNRYGVEELLDLSSNTGIDTNVTIRPEYSIDTNDLFHDLLKENSLIDERFNLESKYDEERKVTNNFLSIDNSNYVKVSVDYFENVSMNYNYISYEKEIKEVVEMLEHIFGMLDKNLGRVDR